MNKITVCVNGEEQQVRVMEEDYIKLVIEIPGPNGIPLPFVIPLKNKDCLTVTVEELNKPPLGLVPQVVWYERRIQAIEEAIERFRQDGKAVPIEWTLELLELTKVLL